MSEHELAALYAGEARRVEGAGERTAAAFWWTQAYVMALVVGDERVITAARQRLRAAGCLD